MRFDLGRFPLAGLLTIVFFVVRLVSTRIGEWLPGQLEGF